MKIRSMFQTSMTLKEKAMVKLSESALHLCLTSISLQRTW